jgi:3-phenylpropionate/trans-cinnamate dioxygenase ferredoxin subunit
MAGTGWIEVASLARLPRGEPCRVETHGQVLVLVNRNGQVHALSAVCPHRGGPLDQGRVWDGTLECPWHHFRYDLASGANVYPANVYPEDLPGLQEQLAPVNVYAVRVEDGRVFVRLPLEPHA